MNGTIKFLLLISLGSTAYSSDPDFSKGQFGNTAPKIGNTAPKSCLRKTINIVSSLPTKGSDMPDQILSDGGQLVIKPSGYPVVRYAESQLERMAASGDVVVVYKQPNGLVREVDNSSLATSSDVALSVLAHYVLVQRDADGNVTVVEGSEGPSTIVIAAMTDAQLQRVLAEYGMVSPVLRTQGGRDCLQVLFGADSAGNYRVRNIISLHPRVRTRFWNGDTGHRLPSQLQTRLRSVGGDIQRQIGWMLTGDNKKDTSIVGMVFKSDYVSRDTEYAHDRALKLGAVKSIHTYPRPSITELTQAEVNADDTLTQ